MYEILDYPCFPEFLKKRFVLSILCFLKVGCVFCTWQICLLKLF